MLSDYYVENTVLGLNILWILKFFPCRLLPTCFPYNLYKIYVHIYLFTNSYSSHRLFFFLAYRTRNLLSHRSRDQTSTFKVLAELSSLWSLQGKVFPVSSGSPWHPLACGCITIISASILFLFGVSLSIQMPGFL